MITNSLFFRRTGRKKMLNIELDLADKGVKRQSYRMCYSVAALPQRETREEKGAFSCFYSYSSTLCYLIRP